MWFWGTLSQKYGGVSLSISLNLKLAPHPYATPKWPIINSNVGFRGKQGIDDRKPNWNAVRTNITGQNTWPNRDLYANSSAKAPMQTINRTDKRSSITIFAFVLELMVQILSVFSVKLTSALEIYRQKHRRTGRVGGGGYRLLYVYFIIILKR